MSSPVGSKIMPSSTLTSASPPNCVDRHLPSDLPSNRLVHSAFFPFASSHAFVCRSDQTSRAANIRCVKIVTRNSLLQERIKPALPHNLATLVRKLIE